MTTIGHNTEIAAEFIDVGTILSVCPDYGGRQLLLDISAEDSTYTDKNVVVDDLTRSVLEKTTAGLPRCVSSTIVLGGLRRVGGMTATSFVLGISPSSAAFSTPECKSANNTLLFYYHHHCG